MKYALIITIFLIAYACTFVAIFVPVTRAMKKHVLFNHNGHKIEILTGIISAKFVVDGIVVDSGKRYGHSFHFDFIKKLDNDTIRVYITRKAIAPEIKLYINDEKQDIEY